MISIRLLVGVILLAGSIAGMRADDWKKVESSEKHVPAWLQEGQKKGTLMVTAEAPSLQEARRMAEQTLMRSIIQAVATNVDFSSTQADSNLAQNDKVTTKEEYTSRLEIAAAKLPFIKGVSLSEAKAQYWERRENKKSKQNLYVFTVLYPLPELELASMRREFEKYDGEKSAEYKRLESSISDATSTEAINDAIASLTNLEEYFFDSVRRTQASTLMQRYRDLFRMVTLSGEKTGDSEFTLRTELRGKPFVTGKIPEVTSECASKIKVTPAGDGATFKVTYSDEDCLPEEQNSLKATLRLATARLATTLHF